MARATSRFEGYSSYVPLHHCCSWTLSTGRWCSALQRSTSVVLEYPVAAVERLWFQLCASLSFACLKRRLDFLQLRDAQPLYICRCFRSNTSPASSAAVCASVFAEESYGLALLAQERRDRDRGEDADDQDHDQKFDQGKTTLIAGAAGVVIQHLNPPRIRFGASPWFHRLKWRYVPLARAAGFATHLLQVFALALALALSDPASATAQSKLNSCIRPGRIAIHLWHSGSSQTSHSTEPRRCTPWPIGVPAAPSSHLAWASTPVWRTPLAAAPGAGDRARLAAEAGDQLAGAATGHTLPRPMGRQPPPRRRLARQPWAGEVSVPPMKRSAGWLTWVALALITLGAAAAAPDPHRPGAARPVLRRGRPEHGALLAQLLLRRVRARRLASRSTSRPSTCGCRSRPSSSSASPTRR